MKLKVLRVVTASHVVPWHLNNTLNRITVDFDVFVAGTDVSKNSSAYQNVKFIDVQINRKTSIIADIKALYQLYKCIRNYKPDIIHSIMPKAGLLSALAGFVSRTPVRIHTFTGQVWVARTGFSRHLYYLIDRLINFLNTICLTDSPSQSQFLLENNINHKMKPLPTLSIGSLSGVDVSRFNLEILDQPAKELRKNLRISDEQFVFTFLARKTKAKGAIDILMAFAQLVKESPHCTLLFVGPDEDGEIEQLAEFNPSLFINVVSVGHVTNPEIYLAITDVLCLPSYREGFGSIVIDAAALGVPTIGSKIPGLLDSIVDGETGILITAGDINALTFAMKKFTCEESFRVAMGNTAKKRVENYFSADVLYQSLKNFYLEQINANAR